MDNLFLVARQVAILFVLMGFGALMRKTKLVKENAIDSLVNILILVVTPCLIIDVFQRPFNASMLNGLGSAFVFSVAIHLGMILLANFFVKNQNVNLQQPLRLAVVFSNAGFMGVPLEQAVLGDIGVFYGIVYVVVFNLVIWSWGLKTMSGGMNRFKMWINPGTVGIALGAPLFFCSMKLPAVIAVPVHHMANLNTPLAMIVIGYCLVGARFGQVMKTREVYLAALLRLVMCPLLAILLLFPFRHEFDRNMMLSIVIAASAPVAAMVSMFATKFNRDVDASVTIVSGTTLLSIMTMPIIIAFAMGIL